MARHKKYDYLLGGRVTCGCCGLAMAGTSTRSDGVLYQYYRCPASRSKGSKKSLDYVRTCDLPRFRVDMVDGAIWNRIKKWLCDPRQLADELNQHRADKDKENEPLRGRLAVVDDLLADTRRQLERLLDLYLVGDFAKDMLIERKERLEATIAALNKEQVNLARTLEAQTLTGDQIETIFEFAATIADKLEIADADFDARQHIIELLDVEARLMMDGDTKVIYVQCVLGDDTLGVTSATSICTVGAGTLCTCAARSGDLFASPGRRQTG